MKITGVEDKKEILALIEKEDGLKKATPLQKAGPEYSAAFGYGADKTKDVRE